MSVIVDNAAAPVSDINLFSVESLLEPYENYRTIRDLGRVAWLNTCGMYVMGRHDDVRSALGDSETFLSERGVLMNDALNKMVGGTLLNSNGERHAKLRKVIERPLLPAEVLALQSRIRDEAEALVERLVAQRTFDAAKELAEYLPVTIVSELVGLPDEGRENMLLWARAQGDCAAPPDERTLKAAPVAAAWIDYAVKECVPGKLKPGGWAAQIWEAADRGEISYEDCPHLMNDYVGPSLDTTISATANLMWLLAQAPDQWARLRANRKLVPLAISEAVRLETPIQMFSRVVSRDVDIDGVRIPEGSRVILLYASANRDERHWEDPERFDIERPGANASMAFGFGDHRCVGMNLARLEISALLNALLSRVERIELREMRRGVNSVFRAVDRCIVEVS